MSINKENSNLIKLINYKEDDFPLISISNNILIMSFPEGRITIQKILPSATSIESVIDIGVNNIRSTKRYLLNYKLQENQKILHL